MVISKQMHARVFWNTDARYQKGHFDGCTQRTFGQRIRTRYGANPGCVHKVWGKSRMRDSSGSIHSTGWGRRVIQRMLWGKHNENTI